MKYILAHDFGTSADKAALFTVDGALVNRKTTAYPLYHSCGNQVEQEPGDWWRAFCENSRALLEGRRAGDVLCVSFSGTAPNCLCVDRQLKPLGRAMIWQDMRAAAEAERLSAMLPPDYLQDRQTQQITADRMLPKLLWIREHKPELYRAMFRVLPSASSYIILRLTGRVACDYGMARTTAVLSPDGTEWSEELLRMVGIRQELLPDLHDRTDIVGEVSASAALECGLESGTPVVMGTIDNASTAIGVGILHPGDIFLCGGTSASIEGLDKTGERIGRATSASGGSLNWLKNHICCREQDLAAQTGEDVFEIMNREIERAPVGSNGVIFQPYLAGARSVFDDPRIKGSFTGITLDTSRSDLMRSVVEGIGFDLSLILEMIRRSGTEVTRMPIVGGLGQGKIIRQIFADIMDVELAVFSTMDEAAAVGAAVLGGMSIGLYSDVTAVERFLHLESITTPNAENHQRYEEIRPIYQKIYAQLRPVYNG